MFSVDLNFLSEDEVEAIVCVIEKDFELKAAEKARLCKLRKTLINIDQRATFITRITGQDNACLVCGSRFIPIINPKQSCSSCSISVCRNCCVFVKSFQRSICKICHKQKDLLAMNCTWFYDNMRQKYMDGGSQIVVNSLSEYPRKNVISSSILGMVKGAQITKFKHQIQITNNTILESLLKVESLSTLTAEMKSRKYTELLSKYKENLKQIIRNVLLVLFITLENYNNKIGTRGNTTDLEVLTTLHEEVELMVGKKVNIRICKEQILYENKGLDDLDSDFCLEEILSAAILEKLCSDHLQYIMDVYKLPYDDVDPVLKSMVKQSKMDSMEFDFDSVSQVPSRRNTMRQSKQGPSGLPISSRITRTLIEQEDAELDDTDGDGVKSDDSRNSSVLYKMSGKHAKSLEISRKWNHTKLQAPTKSVEGSYLSKTPSQRSTSSRLPESMKLDSDTISMVSTETTADTKVSSTIKPDANWLLHARCPSLNSLTHTNEGEINGKSQIRSNQDDLYAHLDEDIEHIYKNNTEFQQRSQTTLIDNRSSKQRLSNINREYRRNYIETVNPNLVLINKNPKSEESQDSGIVISSHSQNKSPLSRSNSIRLSRNEGLRRSRSFNNQEKIAKPITKNPEYDEPSMSEDSDIDVNNKKSKSVIMLRK